MRWGFSVARTHLLRTVIRPMNTPMNFAALGAAMAEAVANGDEAEVERIKAVMHARQPWRRETPEWQDVVAR
jgi:hypothetical protein